MTSSGPESGGSHQQQQQPPQQQQQQPPQSVLLGQGQQMTLTGSQGQQLTVIPATSIAGLRTGSGIIQVPNLQAIPLQNIPGLGNVQLIPASALSVSTQNQLGLSPAPGPPQSQPTPSTSTISNLQPATQLVQHSQHIQQDPNDPNKWQVITTTNHPPPPQNQQGVQQGTSPPVIVDSADGLQKIRVRRVACTCPNCSEGER